MNISLTNVSVLALMAITLFSGCGGSEPVSTETKTLCASSKRIKGLGPQGSAFIFSPDPLTASGNSSLKPDAGNLDQFRTSVTLSHLRGEGVLDGLFIQSVNGAQCDGEFGAFNNKNNFSYSHSEPEFQESMSYYYGDTYQSYIRETGYLLSKKPIMVVSHCQVNDNAFYVRATNPSDPISGLVCLGDSSITPGASYADDAVVILHELQHGNTGENYSSTQDLNQLFYDEAGSMNEAISDFMALLFEEPLLPPGHNADPKTFSRWALGTFDPESVHSRGVHRCPTYDARFPNCDLFPAFNSASNLSAISYVYPDGMGWPYTGQFGKRYPARQAYLYFTAQQESHNASVLLAGALWDVYEAIQRNHPGESISIRKAMTQLVHEAIRHLPPANFSSNRSPVTYINFADKLVTYSTQIAGLSSADQASIAQALKLRGLYDYPALSEANWAEVGPGTNTNIPMTTTPGVHIKDDPTTLKRWLKFINPSIDPSFIPQKISTGLNSALDPGEVATIWFDIANQSEITAGGVLVTVTSDDPDVKLLGDFINPGALSLSPSNQVQVMYGKINGKAIVRSLRPDDSVYSVPLGNTYFTTDPYFYRNFRTAIWVKVSDQAPHGKVVPLRVTAQPSNGVSSTQIFNVTIH